MKIVTEMTNLIEFEAWAGAKDTLVTITEADKGEEFINLLEDMYPEGLTETELNDILWFEPEWCYEQLGIEEDDEEEVVEDEH